MPSADSTPVAARRAGRILLLLALSLAAVLGCQGLTDPWEHGSRGTNGSAFIGSFVRHHVELGLGLTHGGNVTAVRPFDPPQPVFYVHHPPTYSLLLALPAALFGFSEAVLRLGALLIFLGALPALWWVAQRFVGPVGAGAAALLLAAMPLAGYFGPMVNPDGAVLVADLWLALVFLRWAEQPTRGRAALLLLLWIGCGLIDWTGYFAGLSLLCFVPLTPVPAPALRRVLLLGVASLIPLLMVLGHVTWLVGGVRMLGVALHEVALETRIGVPTPGGLLLAVSGHLRDWVTLPLLSLAALGVVAGLLGGRPGRRALGAALALAVPGIASAIAFPAHAVMHNYWCLAMAPGLALAAALPLAWAAGEWRRAHGDDAVVTQRTHGAAGRAPPDARPAAVSRGALVVLLLLTGGAVVHGAGTTLAAVERHRTTLHRDLGELLNSRFGPGDVVCTAVSIRLSAVYTEALLLGPVADMDTVRHVLREYARPGRSDRQIGFLLPASAAGTPFEQELSALAPREQLGRLLLYCVRG